MTVSVRTRFEVFKRDRFTCTYCGNHPPDVLLEVDHVTPRAAGGTDDADNLITSCQDCNRGKAARLLEEGETPSFEIAAAETERQVVAESDRLAQAKAYREQLADLEDQRAGLRDELNAAWALALDGELTERGSACPFGYPDTRSLNYFIRSMPVEWILDAITLTGARFARGHNDYVRADLRDHCTRYFYSICHRWIREGREE